MVYLIMDSERPEIVLLVKAETQEGVTERLHFKPTEKIIGSLTGNELSTLQSSSFAVVCS